MQPSEARAYKQRWKAVAEIERREQREASIETRWKQLNAILHLAIGLGLPLDPDPDKLAVYRRWARLKKMYE